MNAVSFSSVSEASAAFALGPVRFRCLKCDGAHRSSQKGWQKCAETLPSERFGGLVVRGCPPASLAIPEKLMLVDGLPSLLRLGRRSVIEGLRRIDSPEGSVGPFPEVLSLTVEAFDEAVLAARMKWWEEALSVVSSVNGLLSEAFPEVSRPAVPIPSVAYDGYNLCLFFRRWLLRCTPAELSVAFYAGISLRFSVPDAPAYAGPVLGVLGVDGVRVVDTGRQMAVEPAGTFKEANLDDYDRGLLPFMR